MSNLEQQGEAARATPEAMNGIVSDLAFATWNDSGTDERRLNSIIGRMSPEQLRELDQMLRNGTGGAQRYDGGLRGLLRSELAEDGDHYAALLREVETRMARGAQS